jgi:hypothetical protein
LRRDQCRRWLRDRRCNNGLHCDGLGPALRLHRAEVQQQQCADEQHTHDCDRDEDETGRARPRIANHDERRITRALNLQRRAERWLL